MDKLYDVFLPIVQDLNMYGGNFTAPLISRVVLDAIDAGAISDPELLSLKRKFADAINGWKGLQDHQTFSSLFEAYYEAVFYLVAQGRGVSLTAIPAGSDKGSTPDFRTARELHVAFEVKTVDVTDPKRTYDKTMLEGLEAHLEATGAAAREGVGMAVRVIAPHGDAKDAREAVEQVMKKIDGNVKRGQYRSAPTFLVVSMARTGLQARCAELRARVSSPDDDHDASGHLFAIAAHKVGDDFYSFSNDDPRIRNLGPLNRAGILRDHPFVAGIVFIDTQWSKNDQPDALKEAYQLNGIWNSTWSPPDQCSKEQCDAAAKVFNDICDSWNDTEDTRAELLPTSPL